MLVQVPPSAGLPSGVFQSSMQTSSVRAAPRGSRRRNRPARPPITTTSKDWTFRLLKIDAATAPVLERFFDRHQRQHRFAAATMRWS